jgi:hypothetical protein
MGEVAAALHSVTIGLTEATHHQVQFRPRVTTQHDQEVTFEAYSS